MNENNTKSTTISDWKLFLLLICSGMVLLTLRDVVLRYFSADSDSLLGTALHWLVVSFMICGVFFIRKLPIKNYIEAVVIFGLVMFLDWGIEILLLSDFMVPWRQWFSLDEFGISMLSVILLLLVIFGLQVFGWIFGKNDNRAKTNQRGEP